MIYQKVRRKNSKKYELSTGNRRRNKEKPRHKVFPPIPKLLGQKTNNIWCSQRS